MKSLTLIAAICYATIGLLPRLKGLDVSVGVHREVLLQIMRLPILFFAVTPVGRLLSKFSQDIDIIEEHLPLSLNATLWVAFEVNF